MEMKNNLSYEKVFNYESQTDEKKIDFHLSPSDVFHLRKFPIYYSLINKFKFTKKYLCKTFIFFTLIPENSHQFSPFFSFFFILSSNVVLGRG